MRREQRTALTLIALSQLLALTLWFSASAVGPQLESEWQLTQTQTGTLTLVVQIGFVLGALGTAISGMADVVPARKLFVWSAILGAGANAAFTGLNAGQWTWAIALRFVTGVALAGVYPAGLKVMSGWFTRNRGMALGLLVGALTVGSAGPHLIRGMGLEWRGVVLAASGLALLGAAIMALGVRDGPHEVASASFSFSQIAKVLGHRGYRLSTIGYWGHMWELYAMWTWTAAFLAASSIAADQPYPSVAVMTFSVISIGGVGAFLAGRWADRFGRTRVAGGSLAISGTCALLSPLVFGAPAMVTGALFAVWGFAVVADSAQFSTMATETSDSELRGTALAFQTATGFLLTLVTIRAVPAIAERWGWQTAFPMLALGPIVGIVAMAALRKSPHAALLAGGRG